MTKQEQIENMISVMAASNNPFVDVPIEIMPQVAKALYNAGYRKVPDGAVIIPAEERDGEMKAYNEERAELEREIEKLKIQLEQANAGIVNCSGCRLVEINAVKEFAEKLKEKLNGYGNYRGLVKEIDELLKEYEVEE